ncbi:pentatricopeptide repeat-containing protein At3g50420 [Impatiens glandulifera]|uniref:pentatricopeptide repeat-containing protein At3g50420 n=1 Tax=Impatiens glandulifera TaxID=253017 RepID=UPI001FB18B2C|nr:pentatricopeptide repeat-containing protein At3g50420 [Impatiens glandulifera]
MQQWPEASSSLANFLIQSCSSTTNLRKGRQIHALVITAIPAILRTTFLSNNILSMYCRCESLTDARHVFDKMPDRTIVSYNALIASYSRRPSHAALSFELLSQAEIEGLRPNGSTFTSLVHSSSLIEDLLIGSALHTRVILSGFLHDVRVLTSLLGMYSKCGDVRSAEAIFMMVDEKDTVAWNSMIFGYLKNDKIVDSIRFYARMVKSRTFPTQFTYSMALKACSKQRDHDLGRLIHGQIVASGTLTDLNLQNSLLAMYCSCNNIQDSFQVFKQIDSPNLISLNSMIAGYSENGCGMQAMEMFVSMPHLSSTKPDDYTFAAVISAVSPFPSSDYGKPLHAQVIKSGCENNPFVGCALVSMYFNNGEARSARDIFSFISNKDVVLWTEMIAGHCRVSEEETAVKFFQMMIQEGQLIDSFALSSSLSACANLSTPRQGEMVHSHAMKTGNHFEMSVCGSLIDMYSKTGDLEAAKRVLSEIGKPDLKCWNSMLGGYGQHGKGKDACGIFDEILKRDLKPDQVTFVSILSACSHNGLVKKGKRIWNYMKEIGIEPGFKHYSCMVSLLSRAGKLEEAEEIVLNSQFVNNSEVWRILLSCCVLYGNVELGVRVADRVLGMVNDDDDDDRMSFSLIANVYAAAGEWDGVKRMRRKMRGMMAEKEKDPGLSWIQVMNNFHVFSSDDLLHPMVHDLHYELQHLLKNMEKSEIDQFLY